MATKKYTHYMLGLLLVVLAFNNVDRLALGLVLQEIKLDLHLSDTQLGLLSGIAFALFYSIMGIPIARWADRGNRVTIISLTTFLWSIMVALCGFVTSFGQLLLIRVGVAIGEAGCIPPAHSLIASHFTRGERPRAVSIYMLGMPLSMVIGYFLAGWINEFYGWRLTFITLGLPGLLLALLARLTLREPRRIKSMSETSGLSTTPVQPGLKEVCVTLWCNRTFRSLLFCFSVMSFFGSGIGQWQPAYFVRDFKLQTGELGTWFAIIYGLAGLLGTYAGGELAARRARLDEARQLKAMALVCFVCTPISALIYLSPNYYCAFGSMGIVAVGGTAILGPLFATIQSLVPERMRATSIALIYLSANLIGMGLGPLAAGALSDALRPLMGEQSLRYALIFMCPGYLWGGWHLWCGSTTVAKDLEAAQFSDRADTVMTG